MYYSNAYLKSVLTALNKGSSDCRARFPRLFKGPRIGRLSVGSTHNRCFLRPVTSLPTQLLHKENSLMAFAVDVFCMTYTILRSLFTFFIYLEKVLNDAVKNKIQSNTHFEITKSDVAVVLQTSISFKTETH